jgi:two-component system OmpR family sensor kinase
VGVLALSVHLRSRTDAQLATAAGAVAAGLADRPEAVLREQRLRLLLGAGVRDGRVHLLHDGTVVTTVTADGRSVPEPDAAAVARLDGEPRWLAPDVRAVRLAAPGLEVELEDGERLAVDGVVLARDTSADTTTVRRTASVTVLTGLLVTAGTVALSWWAVGRGLAPVRRMARDAERIAAGETDLRLGRAGTGAALAETAGLAAALDQALDSRAAAERRVRDFVADAAHELRTPLTSVHGWADLYLQGALDADGVDRAMERIGDATTRMRRLVEEMALLARLDADVPLARGRVDLGAVVDDALGDLDVLAPDRPVAWERPTTPVVVSGDRERLAQVVGNLVGNVLRHTPADAALTVRLAAGEGEARLEVHDDGPGVPPEVAPRAFERFVRQSAPAGPEHTGERAGSGLGLAIVAAVVRAHGGTVTLDSAPGRGTTVEVRLPLA